MYRLFFLRLIALFLHKFTWIVLSVHKLNKLGNSGKFMDNTIAENHAKLWLIWKNFITISQLHNLYVLSWIINWLLILVCTIDTCSILPLFPCGWCYRQQGNSSIHGSEIRGLSSRAGYNDARTVMENDYLQ